MVEFEEYKKEKEDEEEDISYDELKKRMWKDRMRLQKLKEKGLEEEIDANSKSQTKAKQQQYLCQRKKMSKAQNSILKYMVIVSIQYYSLYSID